LRFISASELIVRQGNPVTAVSYGHKCHNRLDNPMSDFIDEHAVFIDHKRFGTAVEELSALIEAGASESALQSHLSDYPFILSEQFAHCHHVFPKVCLGTQYETDFFCLDIPSSGYEWCAIELESTKKKVITKSGRKTAVLEHALQQIRDWRQWVAENLSYARGDSGKGLGLKNIQSRFFGYVVIGRRKNYSDAFNAIRSQVYWDEAITIRSWDGIVERSRKRADIFSSYTKTIRYKMQNKKNNI
jgi:hypothetical protein